MASKGSQLSSGNGIGPSEHRAQDQN